MITTSDMRNLLTKAFSDEEITTLCFDHFRAVYENFSTGMSKGQKIQHLLDYCERRKEWPVLLTLLHRERPEQFAAFLDASGAASPSGPDQDESAKQPVSSTTTNISGGVNLSGDNTGITGDVTGRDKVVTINGNVYIIHLGDSNDPLSVVRALDAKLPTSPVRPRVDNPFYTKGRINDPSLFFNRERLVREIREELKKRNSVALAGDSQTGKSSLLYYLHATRDEWLPGATVAFVDLQMVWDESDFFGMVLGSLGEKGDSPRELRRVLEGRDVILLLDEVEQLADKDFSPKLHGLLRAHAQESNFAMCVATQHPLEEVFPPRSSTSPFHNIFTRKTIGPFTEAEARRFLAARLQNTGVAFTEREVTRLIADSHCHPAELQQLAKALFDGYQHSS